MNNPSIPPAPTFTPEELGPRCLVVGGGGYVGSAIVQRLVEAGCSVRSFDMVPHTPPAGVEVLQGDLCNADDMAAACTGMDTVFHTAALIKLLSYYRPSLRKLVYKVNVDGTRMVAEAASAAGITAMVHTSSFNVVMDRNLHGANESQPYATRTGDLYTLSKIESERVALAADSPGGLRVAALRPGGIWGSDTRCIMIKNFLTELVAGRFKMIIGDGTTPMDNTHVENLVDAQLLAAKALRSQPDTVGGQPYFITDNEVLNALEWFRPLTEALGYSFPNRHLPRPVAKVASVVFEVAHLLGAGEPTLTYRGVRNLTESSHFSIDKARSELGYEPRYHRANGIPLLLPQARQFIAALQQVA